MQLSPLSNSRTFFISADRTLYPSAVPLPAPSPSPCWPALCVWICPFWTSHWNRIVSMHPLGTGNARVGWVEVSTQKPRCVPSKWFLEDSGSEEPIHRGFGGGWILFSFLGNICLSIEYQEVCMILSFLNGTGTEQTFCLAHRAVENISFVASSKYIFSRMKCSK